MVQCYGGKMEKVNTQYLIPHLILWGAIYLFFAYCFELGFHWFFWILFLSNLIRHGVGELLAMNLAESVETSKKLFALKEQTANELLKSTKDNLKLIEINKTLIMVNEDLVERLKKYENEESENGIS